MNIGYIDTPKEGIYTVGVYLRKNKQIAPTKNGKECGNLVMQDKTGTIDAKVWDLGSPGVEKLKTMDYVHVEADVTLSQNSFQLNMRRIRRVQEGEHVEVDYLSVSKKDIKKMYEELLGHIRSAKNPYFQKPLCGYFVENAVFAKASQFHSATRTAHHRSMGGLLEYTPSVTRLRSYYVGYYPMINRDLLLTAAIFHDISKTRELPYLLENDCADDGQLLGHIIIGTGMVGESIHPIPGFPERLATKFKHCILAHHGELEYDSPKKPMPLKALALNFADNTDAKVETMIEALRSGGDNKGWLGYNRLLESSIRKTTEWALRSDNKER